MGDDHTQASVTQQAPKTQEYLVRKDEESVTPWAVSVVRKSTDTPAVILLRHSLRRTLTTVRSPDTFSRDIIAASTGKNYRWEAHNVSKALFSWICALVLSLIIILIYRVPVIYHHCLEILKLQFTYPVSFFSSILYSLFRELLTTTPFSLSHLPQSPWLKKRRGEMIYLEDSAA